VALTADLIAGFPGERQADLEQTLAMVEAVGFAKVHVFPFSPREGTAAAGLPGRPPPVELKARAARLRAAGLATRRSFLRAQIGRRAAALVERNGTGLTSNYVRLRVPGAAPGEIRQVQVTRQNLVDAG
jgi:threonylcarbamoyladenosine tRNA methylthiotransferase MtaB